MKILYLFELEAHIVGKEREKGINSNNIASQSVYVLSTHLFSSIFYGDS